MNKLVNISDLPGRVCNFELSGSLVQLGFNDQCNYWYTPSGDLITIDLDTPNDYILAPFLFQVEEWLEINHRIHIEMASTFTYATITNIGWYYRIFYINHELEIFDIHNSEYFFLSKSDALEEAIPVIVRYLENLKYE